MSFTISPGQKVSLTFVPNGSVDGTPSWDVSGTSGALDSISEMNAVFHARQPGAATITATLGVLKATLEIEVVAPAATSAVIEPGTAEVDPAAMSETTPAANDAAATPVATGSETATTPANDVQAAQAS